MNFILQVNFSNMSIKVNHSLKNPKIVKVYYLNKFIKMIPKHCHYLSNSYLDEI